MKKKLSDVIENIVFSNDFLEEWLIHNYINLSKLSSHIVKNVQSELWDTTVSEWAIKMALSRLKKSLLSEKNERMPTMMYDVTVLKGQELESYCNLHGIHDDVTDAGIYSTALIILESKALYNLSSLIYQVGKLFHFYNIRLLSIYYRDNSCCLFFDEKDIAWIFPFISNIVVDEKNI